MGELYDPVWQMSSGEQAAVEGLLTLVRPRLAVEIGTADGAGARRIAARVEELHCFDLQAPPQPLPDNATMHVGDSHAQLPAVLAGFAEEGRNVDLAVVDGDHSAGGVRQDLEDLLDSPALGQSVILIHDTANERVRSGLDATRFAAWPKVVHVHLDWVPGQVFREPGLLNESWYGLGLVVVDASRTAYAREDVYEQRYFPAAPLLRDGRDAMLAGQGDGTGPRRLGQPSEIENLRWELEQAREEAYRRQEELSAVLASPSWRLTAPLREAKHRVPPVRRLIKRRRKRRDADRSDLG